MINYDDYIVNYNKQAMLALKNDQISLAVNLLNQAEDILKRKSITNLPKLQGLTYNNLGCFYKRTGDYPRAIKYFQKSLNKYEKENPDFINQAGTHLNLCAVYSILVDHKKALNHALLALGLLKLVEIDPDIPPNPSSDFFTKPDEKTQFLIKKPNPYIFTLVMAYYNAGLEFENVSDYTKALIYYTKAKNHAISTLGESHKLTSKVIERLQVLQGKMNICHINPTIIINNNRRGPKSISTSFTPKPKKRMIRPNRTPMISRNYKAMRIDSPFIGIKDQSQASSYIDKRKNKRFNYSITPIMPGSNRSYSKSPKRVKTSLGSRKKRGKPHVRKNEDDCKNRKIFSKKKVGFLDKGKWG
ncbi:hypothetical protein SteCoe_3527 [Stentor coeruleus]|uniref:Uncharacterized protein n=1 Tax=Stentor coeruleus TaxID=5963 RepID=A0A1R2CX06_9CILI|nr:hypothetical protein SteCoe_3527 [Stentor coeruleus]